MITEVLSCDKNESLPTILRKLMYAIFDKKEMPKIKVVGLFLLQNTNISNRISITTKQNYVDPKKLTYTKSVHLMIFVSWMLIDFLHLRNPFLSLF